MQEDMVLGREVDETSTSGSADSRKRMRHTYPNTVMPTLTRPYLLIVHMG